MKICRVSAGVLAVVAGHAVGQQTLDGVFDPANEADVYGGLLWVQDQNTSFGDNELGDFIDGGSGDVGDPENVTTGVEIRVPLSILGGAGSVRIAGWVTSADRSFMSNQIIHDGTLPIDTDNIGSFPIDFVGDARFPGVEWASATPTPDVSVTVDGTLDGSYGAAAFIQTNYTGFGDNADATDQGGGGSEIDGIYMAHDGSDLYIFVAGNLEANGNGLDLYLDTDNGSTGQNPLSGGGGAGAFVVNTQSGTGFDGTFSADYVISVNSVDNGGTIQPRLYAGDIGAIAQVGDAPGFGPAGAGDFGGGFGLAINNSNTAGVIGEPVSNPDTPMAPDEHWAYGSEINNIRANVDMDANRLNIFIGGNIESNFNKLVLWFDSQPGGQNPPRNDNIDISFNGLNRAAGLVFDGDFAADYWIDVNNGGELENFADLAVLRTDGPLFDPLFGVILDYGSFFGGLVTDREGNPISDNPDTFVVEPVEVMDFSGDQIDIQDGSLGSLFSNYAPRASQLDPNNPVPGLVQISLDNSNVDGVGAFDGGALTGAPESVNTGIELSIDLDELGWDGVQDILLAGYIADSGFGFVSNQVIGGLGATPLDSLGEVADIDFTTIAGDQFVNLFGPDIGRCSPADITDDGALDFFDVSAFLADFNGACTPGIGDFNDSGSCDFFDVSAFLAAFNAGGCD